MADSDIIGEANSTSATGDSTSLLEDKIAHLTKLLQVVETTFIVYRNSAKNNSVYWGLAALALIIGLGLFYFCHLFDLKFPENYTWQVGYETIIRVSFISLWVYVISFCVKMLKVYLNSRDVLEHKIAIIRSMPVLLNGSGLHDEQFRSAYNRIFDLIISISEKSKDYSDDKNEYKIDALIELLKKIPFGVKES